MSEIYKLSKSLIGHNEDVKAVTSLSNGNLLSVSRDLKLILWKSDSGEEFKSHSRFVNSVASWEDKESGQEFFITGSSDKEIHYWLSTDNKAPFITLKGHSDNVCCLNVLEDGRLISGSWDRTAIVWDKFQKQFTLEGHEAAIWGVLGLKAASILATASADKTIKLWNSENGKLIRTIQAHSDCVRGLVEYPGLGFLSCGNDGVIKAWSLEGDLIRECHGHTSFIYSLSLISPTEFVSCGEDGTVRYWSNFELKQTIKLPCISVWSVCGIPNTTDFVVGSSDPIVRVFSRDPSKWASEEELKVFEDEVNSANDPSNQVGDVNKDDLPDESVLQYAGSKDQEVKMVRNKNNVVEAYQWDEGTQQWVKIGEVTNAVNNSSQSRANDNKTYYKGQYYDYVFDIDIQDGVPAVKLPYNLGEDPYFVAQKFINDNMLPAVYLEQIVEFINNNTQQSGAGNNYSSQTSYVDPYTGASRYVSSNQNQSTGGASYDPYTGASRYVAGGQTQNTAPSSHQASTSSNQSYNNASTGNTLKSLLPPKTLILFKQLNPDVVVEKLAQFNSQVSQELQFSPEELNNLKNGLKSPNNLDKSVISKLILSINEWPLELRFPALDIIRYLSLSVNWFGNNQPIKILQQSAQVNELSSDNIKQRDTLILLGLRAVNNLLNFKPLGLEAFLESLDDITSWIGWLIPHFNQLSGNCQLVLVSLLTNISFLSTESTLNINEDTIIQSVLFNIEILKLVKLPPSSQPQHHSEIIYRALVSLAYFMESNPNVKEIISLNDPKDLLKAISGLKVDEKVAKLTDALLKLF